MQPAHPLSGVAIGAPYGNFGPPFARAFYASAFSFALSPLPGTAPDPTGLELELTLSSAAR
jgi:hypothetical protein